MERLYISQLAATAMATCLTWAIAKFFEVQSHHRAQSFSQPRARPVPPAAATLRALARRRSF